MGGLARLLVDLKWRYRFSRLSIRVAYASLRGKRKASSDEGGVAVTSSLPRIRSLNNSLMLYLSINEPTNLEPVTILFLVDFPFLL